MEAKLAANVVLVIAVIDGVTMPGASNYLLSLGIRQPVSEHLVWPSAG